MKTRCSIVTLAALVLVALPALSETYTVELSNGTSFESRYRPIEAAWDESKVMLLTDVGNWIAVERSDIVSVEVGTEKDGFGKVIDIHTIALGWAPNDAPTGDPDAALDPTTRLLDFLQGEAANRPDYNVNQFVDPSEAGRNHGGLPVGGYTGLGDTAFPTRGGNEFVEPQTIDD
jgi:hypothetical protein